MGNKVAVNPPYRLTRVWALLFTSCVPLRRERGDGFGAWTVLAGGHYSWHEVCKLKPTHVCLASRAFFPLGMFYQRCRIKRYKSTRLNTDQGVHTHARVRE